MPDSVEGREKVDGRRRLGLCWAENENVVEASIAIASVFFSEPTTAWAATAVFKQVGSSSGVERWLQSIERSCWS